MAKPINLANSAEQNQSKHAKTADSSSISTQWILSMGLIGPLHNGYF
jgi:hypothetical protein